MAAQNRRLVDVDERARRSRFVAIDIDADRRAFVVARRDGELERAVEAFDGFVLELGDHRRAVVGTSA